MKEKRYIVIKNKMAINTYIPINILNVNGLNATMKRQRNAN